MEPFKVPIIKSGYAKNVFEGISQLSIMLWSTNNLRVQSFISNNFAWNCRYLENCRRNATASTEMFTEKQLGHNSDLHITSYLSIVLFKILPHSKTKNTKKLSVFGESDSRSLSNFLQTHIFWNFDHISRIYNRINYRNIWFSKVKIILIMTAQVYLFNVFSKKDPHLNAVDSRLVFLFEFKF